MSDEELAELFNSDGYLVVLPVFAIGQRPMPNDPEIMLRGLVRGEVDLPNGGTAPTVALFSDRDLAYRFVKQRFPDDVGKFAPIQFSSPEGVVMLLDGLARMGVAYVSFDSSIHHGRERAAAAPTLGQFRAAILRCR